MTLQAGYYSAEHTIILSALKQQHAAYMALWSQYAAFDPSEHYPDQPPEVARYLHFRLSLYEARMIVVLLTCNLVEALANFYLSTRTTAEQFNVLDRTPIVRKWEILPTFFAPHYTLPGALRADLEHLVMLRNSFSHMKPAINAEGRFHKGNSPNKQAGDHGFIARCPTIPKGLLRNLALHDKKESFGTLLMFAGYDRDEVLPVIEEENRLLKESPNNAMQGDSVPRGAAPSA